MRFICNKDEFLKNASYAKGVVSSKQAMQILSNLLITAKDDIVSISATDLEVSVSTTISAEVDVAGKITVHAEKLLDIIKTFPPTDLCFELDLKNWLSITSTDPSIRIIHRIQGLDAEEYPEIKSFIKENSFNIDRTLLKTMIKKTIYAVAPAEDQRPSLRGIFFDKTEDRKDVLVFVATDGKRLTKIENTIDELKNLKPFSIIVPIKVLNELLKVLAETGDCIVSVTERKIYFKIASIEIASNLIDGQFPSYDKVIPQDFDHNILVETQALFDAVNSASSILDKSIVQVKFEINENTLKVSGINPNFGESRSEVNIEYNGEPKTIHLNHTYLADAINAIEDKEIIIEMSTHSLPVVVRGSSTENHINIIMPIRSTDETTE